MISTVTRQNSRNPLEVEAQMPSGSTEDPTDVQDDDRSSSLSELEQSADEPADAASQDLSPEHESDYDTEAETERLERTPQKLNVSSVTQPEKSPSKLAHEILSDGLNEELDAADNVLSVIKRISPSRLAGLSDGVEADEDESPSRKRKRSESAVSSLSDTDEPLAKRSQSARFRIDPALSSTETLTEKPADIGLEAELEQKDGDDTVIAPDEDQEAEVTEPAVPVRGRKGKKTKRKGKKATGDTELDLPAEPVDTLQEEQDAAEEEEEEISRHEEIAKKKRALETFQQLEREFAKYRERHVKDQLEIVNRELELLKQPSSSHEEYKAQLKCIDAYRDDKIRYQNTAFKYDHQALQVKTASERQQLHSQYFQETRDIRETALEGCYKNLYALQKDRRRWGADESNYAHLYNPNKGKQIAQQAAYNSEVSILSGVAKHVGFPAAPDLKALPTGDIDSDFKFMKIPERPIQPRISLRDAEREAAEKGFFEQNAWANPSIAHAMMQAQSFTTPNRIVSNGSTIDVNMMSASHSQQPTPQSNGAMEATPGDALKPSPLAKIAPQVESSPLATVSAAPIPSLLSATTFPTSAFHGTDAQDTPGPPPAGMSISVGGGPR